MFRDSRATQWYDVDYLIELCLMGYSDREIADEWEVSITDVRAAIKEQGL